jgi:hypothetical protein
MFNNVIVPEEEKRKKDFEENKKNYLIENPNYSEKDY